MQATTTGVVSKVGNGIWCSCTNLSVAPSHGIDVVIHQPVPVFEIGLTGGLPRPDVRHRNSAGPYRVGARERECHNSCRATLQARCVRRSASTYSGMQHARPHRLRDLRRCPIIGSGIPALTRLARPQVCPECSGRCQPRPAWTRRPVASELARSGKPHGTTQDRHRLAAFRVPALQAEAQRLSAQHARARVSSAVRLREASPSSSELSFSM